MKSTVLALGASLALATQQVAALKNRFIVDLALKATVFPSVPSYNATIPVDHFDKSNTATYNNRFWVNDTYYKAGGPVIMFDFGESGVTDAELAFVSPDPGYASAPIELAKNLSGVVIGWEHRYFGLSQPVPITATDASVEGVGGLPVAGAGGYKYQTIEQALEDVVYFANNVFNKTHLTENSVLGAVNATASLDPYHTPWLFVGGSYPGSRAAWIRARNPEVIYASWASSAPVEVRQDGSSYYNSIYRAIPKNCSSDIQATVKYVDSVLSGTDETAILDLKIGAMVAVNGLSDERATVQSAQALDTFAVGNYLLNYITNGVQNGGVAETIQVFCDYMESFDTAQYSSNASLDSTDDFVRSTVFLYNDGASKSTDSGIVATNSKDGSIGLAAYLYGLAKYEGSLPSGNGTRTEPFNSDAPWTWIVLNEFGLVQDVNTSSALFMGSKFLNYSSTHAGYSSSFAPWDPSTLPSEPNPKFIQSLGGWNMQPSHVMWTNGEFDPWRAFGVMSLDQADNAAPVRKVTQTVPACGTAPSGTDVFGLLYGGAVHAEDIFLGGGIEGSIDTVHPPLMQGAQLFIQAYNTWAPCFNTTRATGSTPKNNGAGRSKTVAGWGLVSLAGVSVLFTLL